MSVGESFILNRFTVLADVGGPEPAGRRLVFDPADLLFLDGGVMLRVKDFETPRPVLQVAHWAKRDPKTGADVWQDFPMRYETDVEWADRLEREQRRREMKKKQSAAQGHWCASESPVLEKNVHVSQAMAPDGQMSTGWAVHRDGTVCHTYSQDLEVRKVPARG